MRWKRGRRSSNIEDRRGASARPRLRIPSGLPRSRRARRGVAGGGLGFIVLVVIALFFGIDPGMLLQQDPGRTVAPSSEPVPRPGATGDELGDFVSVVLADTEDTWHALFGGFDGRYEEPKLVLFTDAVESACGYAQAAMGPFYCPRDHRIYIDLGFYRDLRDHFQAPGDFAQAYVIAHEVGHHVQTLLGISQKVRELQNRVGRSEANALSVKLELQADCLAGVWAYHAEKTRQILEQGDIEEGLNAASAIGDDRLQRQASGRVAPDSFTHGSSAQRVRWFKTGIDSGDLRSCDTFEALD